MASNKQHLLPFSYLAPIGYYAILLQHSGCIIEQYDFFVKQTIRNRCAILGANGKLILSIPKKRKSSSKTILKDIQISYDAPWQKLHWKSITSAYRSSAYFEYYEDLFAPLYQKKEKFLVGFNGKLQKIIFNCLQTDDSSTLSTSYQNETEKIDLRNDCFELQMQNKYQQVFEASCGFIPNLSIIDLLFNLGPEATDYLHNLDISI